MLYKWWRSSQLAAIIVTAFRMYLGFSFFTAGWKKITSGFDGSEFVANSIVHPVTSSDGQVIYRGFTTFLQSFVLPNMDIFNILVSWGEFLVGLGLLFGCLTTVAAFFGLVMNFSFLIAGEINYNPFYILIGFFIVTAGENAGRVGMDAFIKPSIVQLKQSLQQQKEEKVE